VIEPANTATEAGNSMIISGAFLNGEEQGGLAIWSDPSNPAPSTSWIIRKTASMQNAAFPGRNPVAIPFDQLLVLKYSLLVFQDCMSQKQIKKVMK
jgi:hypothetical protein